MRIKTILATAVCAPLLFVAGAGAASAGEVTGPPDDGFATGKNTPISDWVMMSECAFSGLNAYHPGKYPGDPAPVQSYGILVSMGLKDVLPSPGVACNGHLTPVQGGGSPE